jgi:hypothetical protein
LTLLLGIAAPWGMWQSIDHRLTALPGGRLITDMSVKHVGIKAPDGEALIGYTGLGRLGSEDLSDWVRKTLRGENRGLEDSIQHIAEEASRAFGSQAFARRLLHVFIVTAFLKGDAYLVAVANTDTPFGVANPPLRRDFVVQPTRLLAPQAIFGGAGVAAMGPEDRQLLSDASRRQPRRPDDYLGLLGALTRRTARSGRPESATISAGCVTSDLPPQGSGEVRVVGDGGEESTIEMPPYVLFGIDTTEMSRGIQRELTAGVPFDLEDAARRAIEPRSGR